MTYRTDSNRSQGGGGTPGVLTSKPRIAASKPRRTKKALIDFIRARLAAPHVLTLPKKGVIHLCQQVKENGVVCSSPALRGHRFCYFHQQWHRAHLSIDERIRRLEMKRSRIEDAIRMLHSLQHPEHSESPERAAIATAEFRLQRSRP